MIDWTTLVDFPRGQRVIRFGKPVKTVHTVRYLNEESRLVELDSKSYLHHVDRIILARDVWPRTSDVNRATVFIGYES